MGRLLDLNKDYFATPIEIGLNQFYNSLKTTSFDGTVPRLELLLILTRKIQIFDPILAVAWPVDAFKKE